MNVHCVWSGVLKTMKTAKESEGGTRAYSSSWELGIRTLGSCRNLSKWKSDLRNYLGSAGRNGGTCKEMGLPLGFLNIESGTEVVQIANIQLSSVIIF